MRNFYDSPNWRAFGAPGHPGGEKATRALLSRAGLSPGSRVLDLCCGGGGSLELLRSLDFKCAGADRENVVSDARVRYPELSFQPWEGGPLPFPSGCFDAVLCECSLSQLEDRENVLGEVSRVLTDEGLFLVSDVYEDKTAPDFPGFECLWFEDATRDLRDFAAKWLWQTGRAFPYEGRGAPGYFHAVLKKIGGFKNGL